MENKISAETNLILVDTALEHVKNVEKSLPFLINLTTEERVNMLKLGDKSRAFVEKTLEMVKHDDSFLPRNFDLGEFSKDVEAYLHLHTILQAVNALQKKIEDTYMLAGSEAYAGGLVVYSSAKQNNTSGELETLIDELGKRFVRKQKAVFTHDTKDQPK